MSAASEPMKIRDDSKVKLISFDDQDVALLDHVPAWFGEACGMGLIRKVKAKDSEGKEVVYLSVKTPTKMDQCKVGDVIKNSLTGGIFVRHFSNKEKQS